jgi:hypothetical protein
MHGQMIRKIEAHLEDPAAGAYAARMQAIAKAKSECDLIAEQKTFVDLALFTPAGFPRIACTLNYPVLKITSPAIRNAMASSDGNVPDHEAQSLSKALGDGVNLHLRVATILDRSWMKQHE